MKFTFAILIAVAMSAALAVSAADAPASDGNKSPAKAQDALQGVWSVKSQEVGGRPSPEDPGEVRLEFDGQKFRLMRGDQAIGTGTFTVDASKQPRQIDISITQADEPGVEGKTVHGIYELKGDQLKWCTTQPGADDRPANFETKETQHMLVTAERRKEKGK